MKTDTELTLRNSVSSTLGDLNGNGLVLTRYMPAEVVPAWPPAVPKDAEFLPIERFSSVFQVLEVKRTFEVSIKQAAYNRMMFYIMNAPGEVSGYGKVQRVGNSFMIEDVIVLEQKNGHSESFITPETTFRFMMLMKKRGLSTEGYNLWWHSHNDFSAFFSGTDLEQIESLKNDRFTLSLVTNKMLEPRCRVDFYRPIRYGIDHLPLKVLPEIDALRASELKAEMDSLIKTKSPRRKR